MWSFNPRVDSPVNVCFTALRELDFPCNPLRFDRHLDRTLSPLAKDFVRLSDIVQRKRVSEEGCQVEPPVPDELHKSAHALFASRTKCRDDLVVSKTGCKWL